MDTKAIVTTLGWIEPIACTAALILMHSRRQVKQFRFLAAYLLTRILSVVILGSVFAMGNRLLRIDTAYAIYFYGYWTSYALETLLGFGIIYSIYNLAMAPLKGLQRLGRLMFRWAAGIAIAIAVATAMGPHVSGVKFMERAIGQLQETQSILTLCMLLFVCLAIRPMGLSHRSKIFGVSLGLGIIAATDLVGAAWINQIKSMMSIYDIINGVAILATISVWSFYFAMPEPRRRMIILPTTSPFLRWNQISLALGDEPGFVAIGEFTPDMFAPAEVEVMRRASVKMNEALTG